MKVNEIRQAFLNFFAQKQHQVIPSSSLVPNNDNTLLFTNSGMVQFKDIFLGQSSSYTKATTVQKSLRAGGKHNDLENVGYTARHHTFFEMLGNFSFGDYFKEQAIYYAWELLTTVYKLPAEKLWVTVYIDDNEAFNIWRDKIGVPEQRIIRIGDNKGSKYASDNFWQMGETGPCGPCSEIFYDHGEHVEGGLPGSANEDGDRYIEIWNLVFMQFNRDEKGNLSPLPKPCVDTGMGLERIAAVLQNVQSNYEIDLFNNLIIAAAKTLHCSNLKHNSLKVIADHLRSSCFLLAENIYPSNEGRGYVLRRIIRRAIRHGYKLGARDAFLYQLIPNLIEEMGVAYPELISQKNNIVDNLKLEEQRFFETISNGMEILEQAIQNLNLSNTKILDGEIAFKLHDTYGFPLDLTADICREKNLQINEEQFNQHMEQQRNLARSHGKFKQQQNINYHVENTEFCGYNAYECQAKIVAIYVDNKAVPELNYGQQGIIFLDKTPFYAESGGQIGDCGTITNLTDNIIFEIQDTQKTNSSDTIAIAHHGILKTINSSLKTGTIIHAKINYNQRQNIIRNHSAAHLLHKALHMILGNHVQQKGSLIDDKRLRFDFSHNQVLSLEQIQHIETIVNQEILTNTRTNTQIMSFDQAKQTGAMALFDEKYSENVRVINIGNSLELCGGTHVQNTGDIGIFKIINQNGIAAGIRRIEALTGYNALKFIQDMQVQTENIAAILKSPSNEIITKIENLQETLKTNNKQINELQNKLLILENLSLVDKVQNIGNIKILAQIINTANDPNHSNSINLRDITDALKNKLGNSTVIILTTKPESNTNKINFIVSVNIDNSSIKSQYLTASKIAQNIANNINGKSGGKIDMAQGGGVISSIDLQNLLKIITQNISKELTQI